MSLPNLLFRRGLIPVLATLGLLAATPSAWAHEAGGHESVKPLFQRALPNVEGKTFTVVRVEFPAGTVALPHRHGQAFVFAYVAQGSVRSQLEGGEAKTYATGESWAEPPGAHHLLTENASKTEPAVLIVTFVSPTGDAIKIDDPPAK